MRSYDDIIIIILGIFIFIVTPVILFIDIIREDDYKTYYTYYYYTYVDLDNNEGIADECKHDRTPICELEDGTVIAVKQYKRIRESKGE